MLFYICLGVIFGELGVRFVGWFVCCLGRILGYYGEIWIGMEFYCDLGFIKFVIDIILWKV